MINLEIIPIGAKVRVGPAEGVVVSIMIRPTGNRYEVGYWSGVDWKEVWFDENLVTYTEEREQLGFAQLLAS